MGNVAFRVLLTFNATSLLVIIFLVQKGYSVNYFFENIDATERFRFLSYILYVIVPIILTWASLQLSRLLPVDEFAKNEIVEIDHANNSFLPSYLGYFFVALSIPNWETLYFVYGILFIFTFLSQALYFNPLFLIFGYEFYNVRTRSGTAFFLISRESYKRPGDIKIDVASRINDYTFIERS